MKGDRMAKRSSFGLGSIVRKTLSDISNSLPQPKSPVKVDDTSPSASSAKEYIDHLVKENMALMKLIADKNKIIELSGIELQKLRGNLQKMQLQNWSLAQSNSHMLAELNIGKEKLKSLQHELVCKDAVLKAKNLELERQGKMDGGKNDSQERGDVAMKEHKLNGDNKPRNRRRAARSRSMGHSSSFQQVAEEETAENKRRCLRRQSANCKREPKETLFEIEDVKFPFSPMHVDKEVKETERTSIGRPLRRAAGKVQSYKEVPLNIKMRRPE